MHTHPKSNRSQRKHTHTVSCCRCRHRMVADVDIHHTFIASKLFIIQSKIVCRVLNIQERWLSTTSRLVVSRAEGAQRGTGASLKNPFRMRCEASQLPNMNIEISHRQMELSEWMIQSCGNVNKFTAASNTIPIDEFKSIRLSRPRSVSRNKINFNIPLVSFRTSTTFAEIGCSIDARIFVSLMAQWPGCEANSNRFAHIFDNLKVCCCFTAHRCHSRCH